MILRVQSYPSEENMVTGKIFQSFGIEASYLFLIFHIFHLPVEKSCYQLLGSQPEMHVGDVYIYDHDHMWSTRQLLLLHLLISQGGKQCWKGSEHGVVQGICSCPGALPVATLLLSISPAGLHGINLLVVWGHCSKQSSLVWWLRRCRLSSGWKSETRCCEGPALQLTKGMQTGPTSQERVHSEVQEKPRTHLEDPRLWHTQTVRV